MGKVFFNDRIIDAQEAKVHISDAGLLYGMGLFETMRCVCGKVFALADHIDRLCSSAEVLSIGNSYSRKFLAEAVYKTIQANGLTDARCRLTLTNGPLAEGQTKGPTLIITATEFEAYPAEYYSKGVSVMLSDYRQSPMDLISGHKTTNYFSRLLVLEKARQNKAFEALWFTTDNFLAEGCVSNVFIVKDSVVYTPGVYTPVLPGIARKTVFEAAKTSAEIKVCEKQLTIKDLLAADEIFLTNVIMTVMPVIAVEAHTVSTGRCGEITKTVMKEYKKILNRKN